ncbi:MAG: hypothetical protein AAF639_02225 [Chloroflexota bacterium]
MLPPSHIAYTWLGLSLAQEHLDAPQDIDYRWMAVAAVGSDLVDKPLALAYFYKRYKSAVLFAHTLIAYLSVILFAYQKAKGTEQTQEKKTIWIFALAIVGHGVCDRIWDFHDTFYWPFRGWRFHVWGKEGGKQEDIGQAYWVTFTRRPELWIWEVGGLLALLWFAWRHRLYRPRRLLNFLLTGRIPT